MQPNTPCPAPAATTGAPPGDAGVGARASRLARRRGPETVRALNAQAAANGTAGAPGNWNPRCGRSGARDTPRQHVADQLRLAAAAFAAADHGDAPALLQDHEARLAQLADAALPEQGVQVAPRQPAPAQLVVQHPPVRDQEARRVFEQLRDGGEGVEPRDAPVPGEHRDQRRRPAT